MNIYLRIGWLSLVFLLLFEIVIGSIYNLTLSTSIVTIFSIVFLPLINLLVQEVKKDFFSLSFAVNKTTSIKYVILAIYGILSYIYGFSALNGLVGFYFVFSLLFVLESRVSFLGALVCLAFCPILLIVKDQASAETLAILAYYFLCIGVCTQVLEFTFNKYHPHDQ